MLLGVPQAAVCYMAAGEYAGYHVVRTVDLPSHSLSRERQDKSIAVLRHEKLLRATAERMELLMEFLKANCTDDNGVYVLLK